MAIARALVADPNFWSATNPPAISTAKSADEILQLLQILNRDHGKTIVIVTHDPKAAEFGSRHLHMDKGALLESGTLAA